MTVRSTSGAQRARLKRTLLAAGGGAVLSLVLVLLFSRGSTWLSTQELWSLLLAFWLVNLAIVLAIATGLNLRLKEPSMTMVQMMWATLSTFTMACFVSDGRHLLLMIYLLTMTFGSFRLNTAQHLLIAVTALASYAVAIVCNELFSPIPISITNEFVNWFVFLFVLIGFSLVGGETGRLRAELVHRNRELRAAHKSTAVAHEAKSRFLASTSHELRTPLNTMLGATDIVDNAALESEQRDALVRARSAGKHLLSLVNTMIDVSRIETGALQIHTQPIKLNDELDTLHAMMLPDAQIRGVELTLDKDASAATPVMGDAIRLQEVLLHLIKLMIRSASVRQVCVRVVQSASDQAVQFVVDGSAFRTHQSESAVGGDAMFENFNLDLCQTLVTLMDGSPIESVVSTNSIRFKFELPMPPAPVQPSILPVQNPPQRSVLIVDDSIDNQLLLQAFLRNQPLELHFAEDGVEAVEAAKQRAFDLILMDMHMPRMNGIEATETIRKIEAEDTERAAARIFAITADDDIASHNRSLAAGCDEHLVKPVSKKNLLQALERASHAREPLVMSQ